MSNRNDSTHHLPYDFLYSPLANINTKNLLNYYYLLIPITIIVVYVVLSYYKITHRKKRLNKEKIKAKVVKYEMVTTQVSRNHYNSGMCIFVKIIDGNDSICVPLNYSFFILSRPFKIDQEIDVFWYASDLYYWNSFENGLHKYLISKI